VDVNILIVEDEAILGETLKALLQRNNYSATHADSYESAWDAFINLEPDLVALDVMLPEGEDAGFEFARELRESGYTGPILFLTARDTIEDRVQGLDLGGDDYLIKPFSLDEFMARVRALLRRETTTKQAMFKRGDLELDFRQRRVLWRSQEVTLSEREFALLELFALNPDKVYTSDELLERIFPNADSGTKVIRVYIHYLRQKIAEQVIVTASGGYRLGV
jgi:two-component system, OmpR family, response regulator QseB